MQRLLQRELLAHSAICNLELKDTPPGAVQSFALTPELVLILPPAVAQDSNPAYQQLLQSELLGRPAVGSPERTASFRDTAGPGGGLGSPSHSPAKKMLRFQAGDRWAEIHVGLYRYTVLKDKLTKSTTAQGLVSPSHGPCQEGVGHPGWATGGLMFTLVWHVDQSASKLLKVVALLKA